MKKLIVALLLIAAPAYAKTLDLGTKSPDTVKGICNNRVHGTYFQHNDGVYGCVFGKGVVQCTPNGHCNGFPRERPVVRQPRPYYEQQPEWNQPWHQEW